MPFEVAFPNIQTQIIEESSKQEMHNLFVTILARLFPA
jgi:hypothetical protein